MGGGAPTVRLCPDWQQSRSSKFGKTPPGKMKHSPQYLTFYFVDFLKFNYSGCDGAPGGVSVLVFVQIGGEV